MGYTTDNCRLDLVGILDLTSPQIHDSMQVVGLRHVAYSTRFAENCHRFKERQLRA